MCNPFDQRQRERERREKKDRIRNVMNFHFLCPLSHEIHKRISINVAGQNIGNRFFYPLNFVEATSVMYNKL